MASRSTLDRIVLLGGGGHASDVLALLRDCNAAQQRFDILGCVDDGRPDLGRLQKRGLTYLGGTRSISESLPCMVLGAVGYPEGRRAMIETVGSELLCGPVVHPTAVLGEDVSLGAGSIVLALAYLGALVSVGCNVLVSYGAAIGHDTIIEDDSTIMPAAVLSGEVKVGRGALVGTNATVLEGRSIGAGSIVGAGSVVTRDVPPRATVVGAPARVLRG